MERGGYRILKLYGLKEPSIAKVLRDLSKKNDGITRESHPHLSENHTTISLQSHDNSLAEKKLDRAEKEIRDLLGPYIFASGDQSMEDLVGTMLSERDLTISVAESCTGGLIGDRLTDVPGSSRYYKGGIIAYSNQAKIELLDVSPGCIEEHGAVSDQTVREMAEGVKKRFRSHIGIAVSGIAGPDGGSREKPVGTVYIGMSASEEIFSAGYCFQGARKQVKHNSSTMVLDWVRRHLNGDPFLPGL